MHSIETFAIKLFTFLLDLNEKDYSPTEDLNVFDNRNLSLNTNYRIKFDGPLLIKINLENGFMTSDFMFRLSYKRYGGLVNDPPANPPSSNVTMNPDDPTFQS